MRIFMISLTIAAIAGCATDGAGVGQWLDVGQQTAQAAGLDKQSRQVTAVKQMLDSTASLSTTLLSRPGGYSNSSDVHIGLPKQLQPVATAMRTAGMGNYVDKVEGQMNQAAEAAAGQATPLLKGAIKDMSVKDAVGILEGGDTAATDYFRQKTQAQLSQKYATLVDQRLNQNGFYTSYKQMLQVYDALPLTTKPDLNITDYIVKQSLNGLYTRMGDEEKLIRHNPKKAGSQLVQQFLGQAR